MLKLYARIIAFVALGAFLSLLGARFIIEPSRQGVVERLLGGHSELLTQTIARTPPAERHPRARELSLTVGYPVRLEQASGESETRAEWRSGEWYVVAPVPDSPGQLVMGPLPFTQAAPLPWLVLLVSAIAALLGWFAFYPLLRQISELQKFAARLGRGDLSVRASVDSDGPFSGVSHNLNQLADRVDQLLSDERDLLRTVAHEVRAPISRMRFRVELLSEKSDADTKKNADGLVADLQQVDALFEELLTYVAFDEFDYERPDLKTTTLQLVSAVSRTVEQVTTAENNAKVTVKGDASAKAVANEKLFARAVTNLLLNALKYGGPNITVYVRRFARECVVDVQDSGPGIPEEDRPKVVKPFVRLTKKQTPGTGLGLAIVSRIMSLHGGRLHIVDAPSGGASVQLVWKNAEPTELRRWYTGWFGRRARQSEAGQREKRAAVLD